MLETEAEIESPSTLHSPYGSSHPSQTWAQGFSGTVKKTYRIIKKF